MHLGLLRGKFLGFIVNDRRVKANPDKIKALAKLRSPPTLKEVQALISRVLTFNRFISRAIDHCHPFFIETKKRSGVMWDDQCEFSFQELKRYLESLPLLASPLPGEDLCLYLFVKSKAISAALIHEKKDVQQPIYYVSKAYQGTELRYPVVEQFTLALVIASRKLLSYFQTYKIVVLTDKPLGKILKKKKKLRFREG